METPSRRPAQTKRGDHSRDSRWSCLSVSGSQWLMSLHIAVTIVQLSGVVLCNQCRSIHTGSAGSAIASSGLSGPRRFLPAQDRSSPCRVRRRCLAQLTMPLHPDRMRFTLWISWLRSPFAQAGSSSPRHGFRATCQIPDGSQM